MTSTKITKESIISSYHVLFWAVSQRVASESWEQIQHHRWMPGCKLQVAAEALSASPVDFASLQDVILFTSYRCLKRSLKHFKTTVSIVGTQNYRQLSSTSQLKIFDWLLNFWWNKSIIDIQVTEKRLNLSSPRLVDLTASDEGTSKQGTQAFIVPILDSKRGQKGSKSQDSRFTKKIAKFHQLFSVFAYFSLAVWLYFLGGTWYLDWNWSQLEWIPEKHWKHSPLEVVRSDWSVLSRPPRRNFGQRFQADEPNAFVTRLRCLYKHFLRKETQSVVFLRSENGANISTE